MSAHGSAPLERYRRSLDQLARAEAVIPLGSQTFSKSRTALRISMRQSINRARRSFMGAW